MLSFASVIHRRYAMYAQIAPVVSNTRQNSSGADVIYMNPPILERSVDRPRCHRWRKYNTSRLTFWKSFMFVSKDSSERHGEPHREAGRPRRRR